MVKKLFLTVIGISNLMVNVYAETNLTAPQQNEIIAAHNKWRSKVGSPAIQWSNSLADTAQAWADSLKANQACNMEHSQIAGLGENLFWASALMYSDGTTKSQSIASKNVANDWASERLDYNYRTNTCTAGKVCGHYTQVVWKDTTEVGCGKAVCADNSQVWVCNYAPAGNYIGQKPY